MRYPDPRDHEPLDRDTTDRDTLNRGGRAGDPPREVEANSDPRDVFIRDISLPRDRDRQPVFNRDRTYRLRGSESRMLGTVGAFRVVRASDLRDHSNQPDRRDADLRSLRAQGLIENVRVEGQREAVVTLTDRGRELLKERNFRNDQRSQTFYAGVRKPRELEHDASVYRAYLKSAERLRGSGAEVRRVVLDYELKSEYQAFLQERNRERPDSDGRPDRDEDEVREWARVHELRYFDDQVHFPDVRIEYELDGRTRYEDVEVLTPHYRGAHAAASAKAGFTRYRVGAAWVGGRGQAARSGRGGASHGLAEELL